MKRGIIEPLPPAIRASIAAADAVLDAAMEWETATNGCSPNRAAQIQRDAAAAWKLRVAVRALRQHVEAAHVAGRVQLAEQERGQRGGDEAAEEQRGEVVHGTESNTKG